MATTVLCMFPKSVINLTNLTGALSSVLQICLVGKEQWEVIYSMYSVYSIQTDYFEILRTFISELVQAKCVCCPGGIADGLVDKHTGHSPSNYQTRWSTIFWSALRIEQEIGKCFWVWFCCECKATQAGLWLGKIILFQFTILKNISRRSILF